MCYCLHQSPSDMFTLSPQKKKMFMPRLAQHRPNGTPKSIFCCISLQVCLADELCKVKQEFIELLGKWCQEKLGESLDSLDQVILEDPVDLFTHFHGFYLANRQEARLVQYNIEIKIKLKTLGNMHVGLCLEMVACRCLWSMMQLLRKSS